jgi:oxalate decarboxylase/phosphoglucose isomerase-like protein (cupin superfamily)
VLQVNEPITAEAALEYYGISSNHERMENGELRFRLVTSDGNGYVLTVASESGAWQNSHSHSSFQEMYIVESKWMALATANPSGGNPCIQILTEGKSVITPLGQIHNVYLPSKAVIHTVRFGNRSPNPRWEGSPSFDEHTKRLSESEILALAKL